MIPGVGAAREGIREEMRLSWGLKKARRGKSIPGGGHSMSTGTFRAQ